jgi:hypothetical protein
MFGFRPAGLNSFTVTPQLPSGWNEMALENIVAFGGRKIDIGIRRSGQKIIVKINVDGKEINSISVENGTKTEFKILSNN